MRSESAATRTRVRDLPRAFWWLWVAELIIWVGRFVVPFMSIFLTTREGLTPAMAGVVVSGYGLGTMISQLLGGVLADRYGRRRVAAISLVASALVLAVIPFSPGIAVTAPLLIVYGLFNGACQPIFVTMVGDLVPAEHRRMAFNYNYWAVNLGYAVGPILAGVLADRWFEGLFFGQAVLMLVAFAVVMLRVPEMLPKESEPPPAPAGIAETGTPVSVPRAGLGTVLRDRTFMVFTVLMFVYSMVYIQSTTTLPMVMTQQGFSSAQYGYLLTANGLLLCLLQIPAARILGRWSAEVVVAGSLIVTAIGVGMQASAATLTMYLVTVCIWTLGELGSHAQAQALASDMALPGARARYQGVYALHFSLATVIGPLLGGALLHAAGVQVLWIVAGATSAVVAIGLALTARQRTARRSVPTPPVAAVPAAATTSTV